MRIPERDVTYIVPLQGTTLSREDEGCQVENTKLTSADLRSANIMQGSVNGSDKYNSEQVEMCV